MKNHNMMIQEEKGSILVLCLIIIFLLTTLGIFAINNTDTEIKIAHNDSQYKLNFYHADGGCCVAYELLEQNIACPTGFFQNEEGEHDSTIGNAKITDIDFWKNKTPSDDPDNPDFTKPTDPDIVDPIDESTAKRDIYYPYDYAYKDYENDELKTAAEAAGTPHTNIKIGGRTVLTEGSAIQLASGYDGVGKGAAVGGAHIAYEVYSRHMGKNHASSTVMIRWRHVIGQEGECIY